MTDAQLTALLAALGTIATAAGWAFRWAVNRLVKAMDDSTGARLAEVKAFGELAAKVEEVHAVIVRRPVLKATGG